MNILSSIIKLIKDMEKKFMFDNSDEPPSSGRNQTTHKATSPRGCDHVHISHQHTSAHYWKYAFGYRSNITGGFALLGLYDSWSN